MKNFRTNAALSLFALGSVAAHAQTSGAFGDNSNYAAAASTASALTRQAVIADLQAARANGAMPHDAEGSDVAYSAAAVNSARSRAEVRAEAIAAHKAGQTVQGEH